MDPMTDDAPQAAPPDSGSDGQDAAHELPEAPSLPDASVPDSPEEQTRSQGLLAGLLLRGVGHGGVRKAGGLRQLVGGVLPVGPGIGRGGLGRVVGHRVHLPVPDPSGTNWGLRAALVGLARWWPAGVGLPALQPGSVRRERDAGPLGHRLHVIGQRLAQQLLRPAHRLLARQSRQARQHDRLAELHQHATTQSRYVVDALPRAPGAKERHGHHSRTRADGQPRRPGTGVGDVAATSTALREDADNSPALEHRERRCQCRSAVAPVNRDLPRRAEQPADRAPEQLDLDHDVRAPRAGTDHQWAIGEAEMVSGDDHRAGPRHPLGADDPGVPENPCHEAPQPATPARTDAARHLGTVRAHRRPASTRRTTVRTASTVSSNVRGEESTVTTPSAAVRNSTTVESWASRRTTWSRVAAMLAASATPCTSSARRASRASSLAVSRIRTSASGAITVVMSRPSATTPRPPLHPPVTSAAISRRCRPPRSARASRLVAIRLTTAEMAGSRIATARSVPPTWTVGAVGSRPISRSIAATANAAAWTSARSTPCSRHHQVAARYIAPVSR